MRLCVENNDGFEINNWDNRWCINSVGHHAADRKNVSNQKSSQCLAFYVYRTAHRKWLMVLLRDANYGLAHSHHKRLFFFNGYFNADFEISLPE